MSEDKPPHWRRLLVESLAAWIALILAEIVHGIVRALTLVPLVGEFRSDQIGVLTGSAIIFLIACWSVRRIGAASRREWILVGAVWVVLTVAFEFAFGMLVLGLPLHEITVSYHIARGGFMPFGLAWMLFAPVMADRWRSRRRDAG